jgi:hypothetical protein
MKAFIWISIAFALLPVATKAQTLPDSPQPAPSGTSDWGRVQDLANGEQITVARTESLSVPCLFAGATRDSLFCDSRFSGREYRFDRSEVERVRMDDKRRNMRILIGSFAAAGFVWGVAKSNSDGTPRGLVGLAGAGLGALAGCAVSVPAAFLIPGRLVYRHASSDRSAHSAALSPDQPRAEPAP